MAIAIVIYFGVGAAIALWAMTGRSNEELDARRGRVVGRLGIVRTVVTIAAIWPWLLGYGFVTGYRDSRKAL